MNGKAEIDSARLLAELRQREREIEAADTPENEARLLRLFATKAVTVSRGRKKGAQRYNVKMANGSIGPVTLFDLEKLWREISGEES